jgi:hypothetical protein
MEAIQRLRGMAKALGNLNDTPQQRIIQDDADYRIVPAQPDFIYEPRYDPDVIYYERAVGEPLLYFGVGYGVVSWLNYDCDWHRHRLYRGDWHEGWDYRRYADRRDRDDDYRFSNKITNVREWRPDPVRRHEQSHHSFDRSHVQNLAPGRDSSRDSGKGDRKEEHKVGGSAHHAGIARPQTIAGSQRRPESILRAVPVHEEKQGKGDSPRTIHVDSKDHVARPKSMVPGTSDAGRGKEENHKKSNEESPRTVHKVEASAKHEPEGRVMHVENPKHDSGKQDEPKHREALKHEEMKRQDEPKHKEAPKQVEHKREEPKRQEAPKHMEAPKHQEQPKHEADKPHGDSSKKGDKKDDDDDKKKKKK